MADAATVTLTFSDGRAPITLPLKKGNGGAQVIDIGTLYKTSGLLTFDPGYMSTAAAASAISFADGETGRLTYRGYAIEALAKRCDYLEVAYLLLNGDLPSASQKEAFDYRVFHHSMVHEQVKFLLRGFRRDAHPMSILGGLIGALQAFYIPNADLTPREQRREAAIMMLAKMPTLVAMSYRYSVGLPVMYPNNSMGYAENFLQMMFATPCESYRAHPAAVKALDQLFILHADHEQNASTSTVRLCASSGCNPYAAISAGISCLSGPKHGGANESALRMLYELQKTGGIKAIPDFLEQIKRKEARLIGFGHRIYKKYDPRAAILRESCHELLHALGLEADPLFKLALTLERVALEDDYFVSRHLYPNVDFYSGIIQKAIGIPAPLFTAIFALARTVGWFAQMNELLDEPDVRLARPRQLYTGEPLREVRPIEERH